MYYKPNEWLGGGSSGSSSGGHSHHHMQVGDENPDADGGDASAGHMHGVSPGSILPN